jgi:hypothetical protein
VEARKELDLRREARPGGRHERPRQVEGLKKKFSAVSGVSAQLTGAELVELAKQKGVLAITPDRKLVASGQFSSDQTWPQAAGIDDFWSGQQLSGLTMPAIAIVDSASRAARLQRAAHQAGASDVADPQLAR